MEVTSTVMAQVDSSMGGKTSVNTHRLMLRILAAHSMLDRELHSALDEMPFFMFDCLMDQYVSSECGHLFVISQKLVECSFMS